MKGATVTVEKCFFFIHISIHAPVKGATNRGMIFVSQNCYFNPRTREGCDNVGQPDGPLADGISIHAPVKGAT